MTTLERMQRFFAERFSLDESDLAPERTLESLGFDSLESLELLFELEEAFEVRVPQDGTRLSTIGDLVALVDRAAGRGRRDTKTRSKWAMR